jgi:glutaconate CoA-transferase subunit A
VDAGFISYETKFGLAEHYRKAVQEGRVTANEHACYTVMSALRAARAGAPFMPVRGLVNSDLIEKNDCFTVISDPFTGDPTTVVRAICPDYAILHTHRACEMGNAVIEQPAFDDLLLARAAKHVIITAEEIVPASRIRREADRVNIPGLLVDAVVPLMNGAKPCSCWPEYEIDEAGVAGFKALGAADQLPGWLEGYERVDYMARGGF